MYASQITQKDREQSKTMLSTPLSVFIVLALRNHEKDLIVKYIQIQYDNSAFPLHQYRLTNN